MKKRVKQEKGKDLKEKEIENSMNCAEQLLRRMKFK